MKQNVKLLFDRRNTVKKTGKGTIEILVYLSREERKWEAVGTADEQSWEVMFMESVIREELRRSALVATVSLFSDADTLAFVVWHESNRQETESRRRK